MRMQLKLLPGLFAALVLAGCGQNDAGERHDTQAAPTPTATPAPATTASPTPSPSATPSSSPQPSSSPSSPPSPVNRAPVADAGPDQTVAQGSQVSLDASNSSDPDGQIVDYHWSQQGNAAPSVTLQDANTAQAHFTAPEVEPAGAVLQFMLTVTDDQGASASDQVEVLVKGRALDVFRVGAAKRSVTPQQRHIDGIDEPRLGSAPHKQRFNLGGFGLDPTQNFPDPLGAFGDELTAPAQQRVHVNAQGQDENIGVRALALSLATQDGGDDTVVFLTLDAVGAGNLIQQHLKAAVVAATGLTADNILFGQTHSHAGPDLQGLWGGVPQDWIENVLYPQAVAAVVEALALRRPATLSLNQKINHDYNNYRRTRVDPQAKTDGHVTALQARDTDSGALIGHVLQYAAHPTSIDEDPRVPHPDYVLGATDWLESQGGVALYYNGPIADASGSGQRPGCEVSSDKVMRPYEQVRCRGEGIAEVVAPHSSSKQTVTPLPAALSVRHTEVVLPVTNPLFVAAGVMGSFNRYYDFIGLPTEQVPGIGPLVTEQLLNLPQITPTANTVVSRIQIGGDSGLEIVTIPGEATNTFGEYIRSLAPDRPMMLLGLTQNSFGYILPEEEFSYIDNAGDDGFFLPFTGYEEFVSLGPLTAPLLKLQGYNVLFDVAATELPAYLATCMQDPRDPACILNIQGQRLNLTQQALAEQCRELGAPNEFCSLLDPDTPLRPLCDSTGLPAGICGLLGAAADAAEASCNVVAPAGLQHLYGSIHEHTSYSDGEIGTTPEDVYAAGKSNGLDFVMVTDHSDNAILPLTASTDCLSLDFLDCLQLSPEGLTKWSTTADMADAASQPDQFTGVRGFEWTSDRFGHINVLFSQHQINAKTGTGYLVSMEDFWLWLGWPSALGGGDDGIAIFNHPGREDMFHTACSNFGPLEEACGNLFNGDPAYAFNDLAYRPAADAQMVGIEMYGKSGDYYDGDHDAPAGGWYAHALDQGWHLGAVGAEDEHGREWTKSKRAKTVLLAPDHSRASLKNALRAQRFYALAHDYNDLQLNFTVQQGEAILPMGSRVAGSADDALAFHVSVSGLNQPQIEVVGPGGQVLDSVDAASHDFSLELTSTDEQYRFVRVIDLGDQDGDGKVGEVVAVSAPIWFRAGAAYPACAPDTQPPLEPH